ncbi:MAG: LysM peptidoglycan-binding domain-containing protein, partial [Alcaligenaceae bacterium]|nr:LysM peptidoglycan-binding domain-containing protein [Alcaligenaceae bacterium]
THTVKRGDTLYSLARRYGTTVQALRKLNNLKGNKLAIGKRLRVPGSNISG